MLEKYLSVKYKDGSRNEKEGLDCWGLTRSVRHFVYGKDLLDKCAGVNRFGLVSLSKSAEKVVSRLRLIEKPVKGAIIGVYKGRVCYHVAVVIEDNKTLKIMDTGPDNGVRIYPIQEFEHKYFGKEIRYYD